MTEIESIHFCEGCEFARGVTRANSYSADIEAYDADISNNVTISFSDDAGRETHKVKVHDGIRSGEPVAPAVNDIRNLAESCTNPGNELPVRFMRFLGKKPIRACGIFGAQNPRHPRMEARGSGYCMSD